MIDTHGNKLQPLTAGWLKKIDLARKARSNWAEMAKECMMFYAHSAQAMWDPNYQKKFYQNVTPPKFRITINKAFEMVALMLPNLFWEAPHRKVSPKRRTRLPEEIWQLDPEAGQMRDFFEYGIARDEAADQITSHIMQTYLNYTPREQFGDLSTESELAVIDALIKGRGVMVTRPFQFPGSQRTLTGSFRIAPEDLLIDPDATTLADAKWIAIIHRDPVWEVARRFPVDEDDLRGKATIESYWGAGEQAASWDDYGMRKEAGQTNDTVLWYEVFSKTGVGARMSGMEEATRDHMEESVGDFAYLAITPEFHAPLNCPYDLLEKEPTEKIVSHFAWPVEHWRDNAWPVECLDFYANTDEEDPSRAWPIPPLGPALGELKLLNVLVPAIVNRTWNSMKQYWAVAGPFVEHYKKELQRTVDQGVLNTPHMVDDVSKAISMLSQPEVNTDIWRVIDIVVDLFEKRTGLNDFVYGQNVGGTQDRTAQTTLSREKATQVRPDFMRRKVVSWQSRLGAKEAQCASWFVTGQDVAPLLGEAGAYFWGKYIEGADDESIVRQFDYSVAASSMERPNRERNLANFMQAMQYFLATVQQHGAASGDYSAFNAIVDEFGELHDMDLSAIRIPEPDPEEANREQQLQERQLQLEEAKIQADVQKAQAAIEKAQVDAQAKRMDAQSRAAESQLKQAESQQKLMFDAEGHQQEIGQSAETHTQDLTQKRGTHLLDMLHDRQKHTLDLEQQREKFEQDQREQQAMARVKRQQAAKPKPSPQGTSQ